MATKTRKRAVKATKRRITKARAKPSENGKQAGSKTPKQPPLKGMEDTDERIPELDAECKRYLDARERAASAKTEVGEAATEIGQLIHKNDLDRYIYGENKFYIEPGAESVKCVKVKQKG